jgi:hypothetical protein
MIILQKVALMMNPFLSDIRKLHNVMHFLVSSVK